MRSPLLVLLLILPGVLLAQRAEPLWIDADTWAAPRSGDALLAMAPLRAAVARLEATPGSRLLLRYPGGENGQLWVQELRSWLLALGIPSERIILLPGTPREDRLLLEIEQ